MLKFRSVLTPMRRFYGTHAEKLIMNPLDVENTQIIRETSSKFPRPEFVSFDLFGTIYHPKRPVAEQYHDIASNEFGINQPLDGITEKFPQIYKKLQQQYPNYGKYTSECPTVEDWWKLLIVELFGIEHYSTNLQSAALCDRLLHHFTTSESCQLYSDVIPTLENLQNLGIKIIGSTNSDDRVIPLLESLGVLDYFSNIYTSYDLGHEKPNRQFFMNVMKQQYKHDHGAKISNNQLPQYLENCWHVGDSYSKDFIGSVKSGWNGILLDRERKSEFFVAKDRLQAQQAGDACFMSTGKVEEDNPDMLIIANNRMVIGNLTQLVGLYERTEPEYTGI